MRAVNAEGTSPWSEAGQSETGDTQSVPGSDTTPEGDRDATPEGGRDATPDSDPEITPAPDSILEPELEIGPEPASTVAPMPSEIDDSQEGGFPWWVIVLLVLIGAAVWIRRSRRSSRK